MAWLIVIVDYRWLSFFMSERKCYMASASDGMNTISDGPRLPTPVPSPGYNGSMDISLPVLIRDYAGGIPRINSEIELLEQKLVELRKKRELVLALLEVVDKHAPPRNHQPSLVTN